MERYVPVEYTSSPIVDILSSTSQECRPTPNTAPTFAIRSVTCCASGSGSSSSPCRNDDDNRSSADQSAEEMPPWKNGDRTENTGDELDARSYDDEFKQEAQTSNSFDDGPDQIALLERIVRTHPVWYLQHVNRSVAVHLLRPMQPGVCHFPLESRFSSYYVAKFLSSQKFSCTFRVFIVRASSKKNSMALSIRLDNPSSADIDHYLIQTDKRTRQVHLQASPFRFKSLPLLIEHYCTHGEELQVRLSLPVAIRECPSTRQLQSIALMGQGRLFLNPHTEILFAQRKFQSASNHQMSLGLISQ
ncbi:unnamed protein product [Anisakis simplex]|uniref:SH2 domain-containing protein n=1 Tax=Anisakis simplex TaxID=6269 RepID=A0A0M3J2M6_ANISI|nr:unnamed protein product [Anisakis simplex]